MMKKVLLAVALAASLLLFSGCVSAVVPMMSAAAAPNISVGNHTDYGGGATGGGYTGGGYTNTTGGSFFGGSGFFIGGGAFPGGAVGVIFVIVVLIIIFAIQKGKFSGRGSGNAAPPLDMPPINPVSSDDILRMIIEHDPNFDTERFISWAKQVFVQLQEAWQARDWKKVRPFESEELFNLHKAQLDEFIQNGTINVMDNICVNQAYLYDYKTEGEYEYLTVYMETSYIDYIIREDTKAVVRGDPNTTYHVNYTLRFMRSLGVTTGENSNRSTTKCPNCGAPVDVNAAGQCAYCDTVITNGLHDWVLCNLDDIR